MANVLIKGETKPSVGLSTPNLAIAIAKAQQRAATLGLDLASLADHVRNASPDSLNGPRVKQRRLAMLETIYDQHDDAELAFERIIEGNELQDANYLARGTLVSKTVMRVVLRNEGGGVLGYGTGFLVGPGLLITNNHVLPDRETAMLAEADAGYERNLWGNEQIGYRHRLDPEAVFYTSSSLDFTLVAVAERDYSGKHQLSDLGWLPLIGTLGKVVDGEWLTIVQHPNGERKQLCVRENQLIKRDIDVLWYSTDTLAGSSGSPVFTNDWLVVALHHSGVPDVRNGRWQTIDGQDFVSARDREDQIKWIANEGIRVSRIIDKLRSDPAINTHPRVKALISNGLSDIIGKLPVMYADDRGPPSLTGQASRRPERASNTQESCTNGVQPFSDQETRMPSQITVTLNIADDGSISLANGRSHESRYISESGRRENKKKNIIDAPVNPDFTAYQGYSASFLGAGTDLLVPLPTLSTAMKQDAAKLLSKASQGAYVLDYIGYSVVMNATRRFAFYSAANIDAGGRSNLSRGDDDWLIDRRIDANAQVDRSFYRGSKYKFDRGHLTRREDMEYGADPKAAALSANCTCVYTNCVPQQGIGFNRSLEMWQGLERYILENTAIHNGFRVQAFTGPVFGTADPVYRGIAFPLDFWKIVVAVNARGKLFATGYVLSQKDIIDDLDIDEAALDVPFGDYGTYQKSIRHIEALTGLKFTCGQAGASSLTTVDPLTNPDRADPIRRRKTGRLESSGVDNDAGLQSFDEIILE